VRVIAGSFGGRTGPASTFSELNVWDVRVAAGRQASLPVPVGHTTALAVFQGSVTVNGSHTAGHAELLVLDRTGSSVELTVGPLSDAVFLLMSGTPLDEPIIGYGPFVMNSRQEIETAIKDFNAGRFGRMPTRSATSDEVVGV
jgi:redox-sensitive bicupin YhaK (pirin superfamily)